MLDNLELGCASDPRHAPLARRPALDEHQSAARGGVGTTKTGSRGAGRYGDAMDGQNRRRPRWGAVGISSKPDQLVSAVLHAYDPSSPALAPLVVVDDVGTETKPGFAEALSELLDIDGVQVVMTCNLSRVDFAARYGKDLRLINRLRSTTEVHDIPGGSKRQHVGDF